MDIYEYDELLVGYISVCSSGLFGRVLLILTDTTHSLSGENKLFIAILTQLEGFFFHFLTAIVHYRFARGPTEHSYQ